MRRCPGDFRIYLHRAKLFFILLIVYFPPLFLVFAASVKSVRMDGVLTLSDGSQYRLAGLAFSQEAPSILKTLLAGKDIEVEPETAIGSSGQMGPAPAAYLYVTTKEANVPVKSGESPAYQRVMVNEILLSLGAASVDPAFSGRLRERFREIQEKARKDGQGIWSYEEVHPGKKQRPESAPPSKTNEVQHEKS